MTRSPDLPLKLADRLLGVAIERAVGGAGIVVELVEALLRLPDQLARPHEVVVVRPGRRRDDGCHLQHLQAFMRLGRELSTGVAFEIGLEQRRIVAVLDHVPKRRVAIVGGSRGDREK